MTYTGMNAITLTQRQADVLAVVKEYGPVTPTDVDYHLNLDRGRSRSVLTSLENRRLIDATYTQQTDGRRAYVFREDSSGRAGFRAGGE